MNTTQSVSITTTPTPVKERRPLLLLAFEALKPERVQEALAFRLSRRQVEDLMPLLPGWRLVAGGQALERTRELATKQVAALYAAFVTGFAGALGISTEVQVVGAEAIIRLHAERSQGRKGALSEGLLGFAKLLG